MKELTIYWQRLVSESSTCPRCSSTEDELEKAVLELKKQGIKVALEKSELTLEEFEEDPIESNRILLNGKSLENLLNGQTGSSQCCDVCGDNKCRTVELKGETHEVITAKMIVEAGLKAISSIA